MVESSEDIVQISFRVTESLKREFYSLIEARGENVKDVLTAAVVECIRHLRTAGSGTPRGATDARHMPLLLPESKSFQESSDNADIISYHGTADKTVLGELLTSILQSGHITAIAAVTSALDAANLLVHIDPQHYGSVSVPLPEDVADITVVAGEVQRQSLSPSKANTSAKKGSKERKRGARDAKRSA